MKEDFKSIAKKLGIVLPVCLLSISSANAANAMYSRSENTPNTLKIEFKRNGVVSHLLANSTNNWTEEKSPSHTDTHTDVGGNHSDSHANYSHSDSYTNVAAKMDTKNGRCLPHTDRHTNKDGYNRHTNSGNKTHTDSHTNRDYKTDC